MPRSIIVIGAGVGGLAAAIRLAYAGFEVTVLEKNRQVGGTLSEYQAGGFRWDIAPAPFYSRSLLESLLSDIGRELDDYLRLLPIDPQTRYFFPDGASLDLCRDWARTANELSRLAPDAVAGYLRFLAYAADLRQMRGLGFAGGESLAGAPGPSSLFRAWLRAGPFRNAYGVSRRFVGSEKLRQALVNCISHSGGSPFAVPAAFSELAHLILSDGLWYPRDGFSAIPLTLQRLAHELGVAMRRNCPVERIEIERGRAIGVMLEKNGDCLRADAVVSNLDAISTARYLLPEGAIAPPALRSLAQRPMSSSAFIMLLGIRGTFPNLAHQNIFFSDDYRKEFDQLFRRGLMPVDPTITLTISCKSEPLHAPVNQENWLIKVSAPPISERIDWATARHVIRDRVLSSLEERHGLDLRDRIRVERHLKPLDLQRMTGAWRGALNGELPHGRRAALAQPQIRSPHVQRLYHVGGAVVPGGGLPQALLSAQEAAALMQRDLR
ncbi:MAG: phytoene desaturase family protein [Chloroflexi bacterium]|nr:phytoene desaturase family protein [Chloroflexota bacterium]